MPIVTIVLSSMCKASHSVAVSSASLSRTCADPIIHNQKTHMIAHAFTVVSLPPRARYPEVTYTHAIDQSRARWLPTKSYITRSLCPNPLDKCNWSDGERNTWGKHRASMAGDYVTRIFSSSNFRPLSSSEISYFKAILPLPCKQHADDPRVTILSA